MNKNQTGIYIHFPYCEKKCPYCDFNSHVVTEIPQEAFKEAYIQDFNQYLDRLTQKPKVVSIFFGGGTPSLMSPSTAENIISHICKTLTISKENLEITLEANPSSFETGKFKDFKLAGINRISIGVQSFIDKHLHALGRVHNAKQAMEAIFKAREIFDRFSFDLIYAREGQVLKQWKDELEFALTTFQPCHVSLYSLTIEKGTKFFTLHKHGKLSIPKNQEDFYERTNEICHQHSLERYEISNYATSLEQCLHNVLYWSGGQYIGIGPGAHGRINTDGGRIATMNFNSPEKYLNSMQTNGNAIQTFEVLDQRKYAWEIISTGLRTIYGFPINAITMPFVNKKRIKTLTKEGLLRVNEDWVIPSQQGLSLCDGISEFIIQ